MAKRLKPGEHGDRGDGTCAVCFEEVPCEAMQNGRAWDTSASGVQKWEREEREQQRAKEEEERVNCWALLVQYKKDLNILPNSYLRENHYGAPPNYLNVYTQDLVPLLAEVKLYREGPVLHAAMRDVADKLMKEHPEQEALAHQLYEISDKFEEGVVTPDDPDNNKEEGSNDE